MRLLFCCTFIHLVVCLTTGPKPLPKRALHIVRSRASSCKWEYLLLSWRLRTSSSSSSCHFYPPFISPSITRCRRQFIRKMWPIQLAFRLLISCRIFLCSLTVSNTSSLLTWSVQLIFSILLQHHISIGHCYTITNKCTINWQIITLLHVSTLLCHPQGARHIRYITFIHPLVEPVFITDCIYSRRVNEQRNILHEIRKRKANWIGHILRRNCLVKQIIEGKVTGQIKVTKRRGRRHKKVLDDLKDRWRYCQLKEEVLDRTMWRNRFGRGFGPVAWQITDDDDDFL